MLTKSCNIAFIHIHIKFIENYGMNLQLQNFDNICNLYYEEEQEKFKYFC